MKISEISKKSQLSPLSINIHQAYPHRKLTQGQSCQDLQHETEQLLNTCKHLIPSYRNI